MSAVSTGIMRSAEERYRTLLDAPSAVADQPTIQAVLHSLRDVLSSTCEIHGAHLYILDGGRKSLHVLGFDREADAPAIKAGTKISCIGAAAQVIEEQKPVEFLPPLLCQFPICRASGRQRSAAGYARVIQEAALVLLSEAGRCVAF